MTSSRKVGVSLIAAGAVLCAMGVVPAVYGRVMSRMEIASFRSRKSQTISWDRSRTQAYRHTLHVKTPTAEAVLSIPRLGVEVPVLEGTSDLAMNRGVGHIAGTSAPGEHGNIAITGHRDGFFRPLKDAQRGDIIDVQRAGGETDHYIVRDLKIVAPSDTSVLAPTAADTLTLITCYPFYYVGSAPQRYIVTATLVTPTLITPTPIALASIPAQTKSGD